MYQYSNTEEKQNVRGKGKTMGALVEIRDVCKIYNPGENEVRALDHVSVNIDEGEYVAIIGQSGSGKSTLMNMLGCLDVPTSGLYRLHGQNVSELDDDELSDIRNREIGFIFQGFNLIPNLTAIENVELAAQICREPLDAAQVLREVGLEARTNNFPAQLSGGEQQRVAIARALAKNPKLLLCDEPTGALDYNTGKAVLKLLQDTCRQKGRTVVVITHNQALTAMADRIITVKSGTVVGMVKNGRIVDIEDIEW